MRASPFLLLLSMLIATLPATASDLPASVTELLRGGDAAYERGDFAGAAEQYQAALAAGADHAHVHYNLGNAYFKQGMVGEAIASYVRAERRAPRDERIRTNLERARAQIRDRELASGSVPAVMRPLPWLYGRFSLNEWWIVVVVAYVLFVLTRVLAHWTTLDRRLLRRGGFVLGAMGLVAVAMGAVRYRTEVVRPSAVVVASEVEVRSGPGRDYPLSFRVHEGLQVRPAETRDEWIRIDLGGELTGWVPKSSLEQI